MNSDKSVVDYTREVISHRLERFERHARLSPEETAPTEIDVPQLATAARHSLAALALSEEICRHQSYTSVRNHLQEAAKIAGGVIEVRFLAGLLQDEAVLPSSGCDRVLERTELRLSRYSRRLAKLRRQMVIERFGEQTRQLVQEITWPADKVEPELVDFAKASIFDAQRQVCHATDLDEPNLMIVHELSSRVQQLGYILDMFQQVLHHDYRESITQDVDELKLRIAPVVDYNSAKMRCTTWLEQSRDADEVLALRSLIALAGAQSEHHFCQLASTWNSWRATQLGLQFERALEMPSNSP